MFTSPFLTVMEKLTHEHRQSVKAAAFICFKYHNFGSKAMNKSTHLTSYTK